VRLHLTERAPPRSSYFFTKECGHSLTDTKFQVAHLKGRSMACRASIWGASPAVLNEREVPSRALWCGKDEGTVSGDGDGVLKVSGAAAVACGDCPAVSQHAARVLAAFQKHRLDRQHQALTQPEPPASLAGIWEIRILMHRDTHSVSAQTVGDAVPSLTAHSLDGVGDIAQAAADHRGVDTGLQRTVGRRDEVGRGGVDRPDWQGHGSVTVVPIELGSAVDRQDVTRAEDLCAGDAVDDDVVH